MKYKGKRVTSQQKIFANEVARTGNLRAAMLTAYTPAQDVTPSELDDRAKNLALEPKIRNEIVKIWEQEGLTLNLAAKRHVEVLKSKRSRDKDVLTAIDLAYKAHGVYKPNGEESGGGQNSMINIFIQQSQARGIPLPKGVIETE